MHGSLIDSLTLHEEAVFLKMPHWLQWKQGLLGSLLLSQALGPLGPCVSQLVEEGVPGNRLGTLAIGWVLTPFQTGLSLFHVGCFLSPRNAPPGFP